MNVAQVQLDWLTDGLNDIFGQPDAAGFGDGGVGVEVLKQHHEFITSESRHHVVVAHAALETLRDHTEKLITCRMAVGVIQCLEMVEIKHHHPKAMMRVGGTAAQFLHAFLQHATVRQFRERVVEGQAMHLGFVPLAFRKILHGPREALGGPIALTDHGAPDQHRQVLLPLAAES